VRIMQKTFWKKKKPHLKFIANSELEHGLPTWSQIKYYLSLSALPAILSFAFGKEMRPKFFVFPRCQQETWKHSIDGNLWRKKCLLYGPWLNTKDQTFLSSLTITAVLPRFLLKNYRHIYNFFRVWNDLPDSIYTYFFVHL